MDGGSRGKPVYQLNTQQDHISMIYYEMKRRNVFLFIWYMQVCPESPCL